MNRPKLDWMNKIANTGFRKTLVCSKVQHSMVCFLAFLHVSRASLARLYQYVVAKTIVVERNSQEELEAHVGRSIRRP